MIIGLTGKKQCGKDTAASILASQRGFHRLAFADLLKDMLLQTDPIVGPHGQRVSFYVSAMGWDAAKESIPEVRQLLQRMGVSARTLLGPDVWVDPVINEMEGIAWSGGSVVITDVRFPNEANAIRESGGYIVCVVRKDHFSEDMHISETAMDKYPVNYMLYNPGTMIEYTSNIRAMLDIFAL